MNAHELQVARSEVVGSFPADGEAATPRGNALLEQVWSAAAGDLGRFVRAMGIDSNTADDVLQDVYLLAWRKSPANAGEIDLHRWLFRVAANRCHLAHRKRGRRRRLLDGWLNRPTAAAAAPSAAELAEHREDGRAVREALDSLPNQERTMLVLRYFQEFNATEIGAILQLPPSTVRSRLRAARQKLADKLKTSGFEHDK